MKFPKFKDLPFALQLVWNPFCALDLTDDDDYPDHDKILPTLAIAGVVFLAAIGHPMSAVIAMGVLAASFGLPMFKTFIESKSFTAVDELRTSVTKTVAETLVTEHKADPGA